MDKRESELGRLLRAARGEESAPEMPYGFDTRVAALARATARERGREAPAAVARFFTRVASVAVIVVVFASAATYWQLEENDELAEPATNAYAMVDTAINSELVE